LTKGCIKIGAGLSSYVDHVIYNSSLSAVQHQNLGYSSKNGIILPNGFDLDEFNIDLKARNSFRIELGVSQSQFLVGYIARFHPKKDHKTFVRAANKIAIANPDVRFVLVGRDLLSTNGELSSMLASMNLEGKIFLMGERNDIPQINAALDVAVSTSAWGEGFPNVIGEAMASGVPCVVTDVGESARVVGDTGKVVQPENPTALSTALLSLLSLSDIERRRLGESARQRIAEEFSISNVSEMYESLYVSSWSKANQIVN